MSKSQQNPAVAGWLHSPAPPVSFCNAVDPKSITLAVYRSEMRSR
jgi:hypothetical protein